jgi:hypothetical protein
MPTSSLARPGYTVLAGGVRITGCLRVCNRNVVRGVYLPRVSDHVGLVGTYAFAG